MEIDLMNENTQDYQPQARDIVEITLAGRS